MNMKHKTKKYFKETKGITLIALVVTIIVLLILAGISIMMLSGNNGILNRAAEAKEKTANTQQEEQVKLSAIAALTEGKGTIKDTSLKTELKNSLNGITDSDITGNEKNGWQVKIGDKAYYIEPTGEIGEAFWEEVKDENGNITEIRRVDGTVTGLHIGDVIGYSAIDGVSSENRTITSYGTVTGLGENNDQIIEIEAGTWKLLGVENGKLKIISNIVGTTPESGETGVYANKGLRLFGKVGYQNAEEELNRVCSLYGRGKYAESGRSINVEDINKITGYDPEHVGVNINTATAEQIANGTKYGQGDNNIHQYHRKVTYSWSENEDKKILYTYEGRDIPETLLNEHNSFSWFDGKKWNTSNYEERKTGKICEITSNSYTYYPTTLTYSSSEEVKGIASNSDEYKLLFDINNYGNGDFEFYWLASNCIGTNRSNVAFRMFVVRHAKVADFNLVYSVGIEHNANLGLRPIVYLKPDIQLEESENGIWQFVEN